MENKRNYGIDLLKALSMFGVVGMHITNIGGAWTDAAYLSASSLVLRYFCFFFYWSVDVFAMITGYLFISKKSVRYAGLVNLLFTVIFWCLTVTGVAYFFAPQYLKGISLTKCLSPFGSDTFWYFRCYIILFIFIPFLNKMALAINQKQYRFLLCALFVTLSCLTLVARRDLFSVSNGYSSLWLIVCYLSGAYIKLYTKTDRKKRLIYLFVPFFNTAMVILLFVLTTKLFGAPVGSNMLIAYTSPLTVVNAISLVIFFSQLDFTKAFWAKLITSASKSSFSVYIAHGHQIFYIGVLGGAFVTLTHYNPAVAFGIWFFTASAIYLTFWLIDILRLQLFKILKLDLLSKKLGSVIDRYTGFN
ncbi:MAG: acyltransferase [Ruminococcaceae bacterium]|nr:acyltransferase [Oscillospiraceae bacterium]